jgi:multicomponent K+:H+ antiporter subunit D
VITGLPPLSGFIAKFSLFHILLQGDAGVAGETWLFMVLILASGLAGIIAMMRFGVRTFWASGHIQAPTLRLSEVAPVSLLIALCVGMTILAGPLFGYLGRASNDLAKPAFYVERVLSTPAIPSPTGARP